MGVKVIDESPAKLLVGVDEVGYGALAGPLVIGGVRAPRTWEPPKGVTDSKDLSEAEVTALATQFFEEADKNPDLAWGIWWYWPEEIDYSGVGKVRMFGLDHAVAELRNDDSLAIVDGNLPVTGAVSVVEADLLVPVCSMASVIAKYRRDEYMRNEAEKAHPGYGFAAHVGYDVPEHRAALAKLGPCAIHRTTYRTVASYKRDEEPQNMWELFDDE